MTCQLPMTASDFLKKSTQNRVVQHLLFWVLSFYVLMRFFAYTDELSKVDFIYTFLFHLSLWVAVYVHLFWLIPCFLRTKKYGQYFLLFFTVLILSSALNLLTFNYLSDFLFPDYYFIAYYGFGDIIQFMFVYAAISALIKLSKGWFQNLEAQGKLSRLEHEKSAAELSALKSQVNPHFLFNSLNNLYSLALDNDKRVPGIILRLSQTMRYLLYESNADFVPLEKEVEHLTNFVEMQRLRVGGQAAITFDLAGDLSGKSVAPLLFLPLVENGFKHGVKGDTADTFIRIALEVAGNQLIFKTENNKGIVDDVEKRQFQGVGLQNLRRRLELIYPNRHHLDIVNGISTYNVLLTIEL